MDDVLRQLTPDQALEIVKRLYERDEEIRQAIVDEARSTLESVDVDEIAEDVPLWCFENLLGKWRKDCKDSTISSEMDQFIRTSCPAWTERVLRDGG